MATRKPAAAPDTTTGMPPGADPDAWGALVMPPASAMQRMDSEDMDAEEEIGARLRAAFGAVAGTSVRVSVYRLDPYTKKREFCINYTPEQFIEGGFDLVKTEFGAGDYEFRSYGSGGLIPGGRGSFSIAKTVAPQAPAAPAVSSELAQVLAMLAQGQRDTQAAIAALAARPAEDPAQSMRATLETLRTMREVFAPPAAPVAPAAPPVDPLAQITMMASAMRAMREIAGEFNPPSDADPLMSALGPVLGMVGDAIKSRQNPAPESLPMLTAPASIASATVPAPDDPQPPESESENMSLLVLKGAVAKLVTLAAANAPATEGGKFIHDSLPDELLMYLDYLNWFEILAQFAPELTPHRVWVEAAKAHAETLFAADPAG
jgi:hypothetical protein